PFWKMSGAGNDFIVVDEDACDGLDRSWLARQLCTRALSVGADGMILIDEVDRDNVRIRFYNPDGSGAEMCGNGSRCAARYAVDRGLVNPGHFRLITDSGDLAVIAGDGAFQVVMPQPEDVCFDLMEIEVQGERFAVHGVQIGVPHAVVVLPNVEHFSDEDLTRLGRALRYDPHFPHGTNTNFVSLVPGAPLRQRTYERGVEALTKACGTGSTATAYVMTTRFGLNWPVELQVDGGRLTIDSRDGRLWLSGDARLIATGEIEPDAFAW
ncbi:MAG TPA: diaminopimelate epimerase, partial [Nitrolancea sp.]|nr:diaminopimelate epimerase [Nitrolancea sp.]